MKHVRSYTMRPRNITFDFGSVTLHEVEIRKIKNVITSRFGFTLRCFFIFYYYYLQKRVGNLLPEEDETGKTTYPKQKRKYYVELQTDFLSCFARRFNIKEHFFILESFFFLLFVRRSGKVIRVCLQFGTHALIM